MSNRRNNIHPSLLRGGPGDSDDELLDNIDREIDGDEDAEELIRGREVDEEPDEEPEQKKDPRDLRIEALELQIQTLMRAIPPAEPRKQEPEVDPLDGIDWDQELFQDPKGALKKYGKIVGDQIRKDMRTEYQKDQSHKDFWKDFYASNKDLKDDHDLVESTMGKHMSELANLPVSEAIAKLGTLTRGRISRYSQRGSSKTRRVVSEGAEAPTREDRNRQPAEERLTVKTMSELINRRRLKRRGTAA